MLVPLPTTGGGPLLHVAAQMFASAQCTIERATMSDDTIPKHGGATESSTHKTAIGKG
ncbi:hypothetical protein J6590_096186 [Homalodisca vitripennis]|nr:hypothetical protein J6590_096186 [Homalodisca vitripennis]